MNASSDDPLAAVDLWIDGSLSPCEAAELRQRVEGNPRLEAETRHLESLHALLARERVEVPAGFTDAVMERLPARRSSLAGTKGRAWAVAVAALIATGAAVTALASWARAGSGDGALGPLAAIGDFFATVALAGAGLLAASWRGLGQLVGGWLGASIANLILGAVVVIGVNLLLISLLRRRRLAAQRVRGNRDQPR